MSATAAPEATRRAGAHRCPCCGRRFRQYIDDLVLAWVLGPDGDELGLVAVTDVAEGAQLPRRLAARALRRPPFERVVRDPSSPGRPWLYRVRLGWRP